MVLPPLLRTLRFIAKHPLNRRHPSQALVRYLRWQIGSRLLGEPVAVPFVEGSRLLVLPGMRGVTGVVYCGLSEFEDMAFVLHVLRADDLFVDVGANVGVYTVLAAAVGATVISFEPIETSAEWLRRNVALNGFESQVALHRCALGVGSGDVKMTSDRDTTNRLVNAHDSDEGTVTVPMRSLDDVILGRHVRVLKIDVEGWELEVLRGAEGALRNAEIDAIVIEVNGSTERYGVPQVEIDKLLRGAGFTSASYDPRRRQLSPAAAMRRSNAIYVRDWKWVDSRVRSAPPRSLPFSISM